jgi:hypothetical protein
MSATLLASGLSRLVLYMVISFLMLLYRLVQ